MGWVIFMREYFNDIFSAIGSILIGMRVTFSHLFTRSITVQYPREKIEMFDRSRNRLHVDIEDCIGCYICEKACPVDCIHIDVIKARPGEDLGLTGKYEKKKTFVFPKFDIDMAGLNAATADSVYFHARPNVFIGYPIMNSRNMTGAI